MSQERQQIAVFLQLPSVTVKMGAEARLYIRSERSV